MRLFFAVQTPEALRAELGALIERLRSWGSGVRWVPPTGIHLTLRFLGEVEGSRLESILEAGRAGAAGAPRLRLRSGGLGTFPERGRPRVVWVGVQDEAGGLLRLHASLEGALEGAGLAREERPFSPHLTLGRVRPGADPRRALAQAPALAPRAFEVDELVLMESFLGPQGARYETRARFALGGTL